MQTEEILRTIDEKISVLTAQKERITAEFSPFIVPPAPEAPSDTPPEFAGQIQSLRREEIVGFGLCLFSAIAMFRKYPHLVLSETIPEEVAQLARECEGMEPGEDISSLLDHDIQDRFMRPEEMLAYSIFIMNPRRGYTEAAPASVGELQ